MSETIELCHQKTIEWKIIKFRPRITNVLKSRNFLLSDAEFYLQLHNIPAATLYLTLQKCASPSAKYRVEYTVRIKQSDGSVNKLQDVICEFDATASYRGIIGINREDLLKTMLSTDGSLKIACTVRLVDDDLPTGPEAATQTPPEGTNALSENLKNMFLSKHKSDVIIKVRGQDFHVHKLILESWSTVFTSMFEHDMAERRNNVVEIEDCDSNSFLNFLLYLYTGKDEHISPDNAIRLYMTADKYDVKELKERCVWCMCHWISIDSFFDFILVASLHNESQLLNAAAEFFIKNVKAIIQSEKWETFLHDNTALAKELLDKMTDTCVITSSMELIDISGDL